MSTAGAAAGFVQCQVGVERTVHTWGSIHTWSLECRHAAGIGCCPLSSDPKVTLGACFSSTEWWINFKAPNTKWEFFLPVRKALLWQKLPCLEHICAINHDGSMSSCGLHATLASGILALNILHLFLYAFSFMVLFILLHLRHESGMNQTTALFCPVANLCKVFVLFPASLCVWCGEFEPTALVLLGYCWIDLQHSTLLALVMRSAIRSWCHCKLWNFPGVWAGLEFCSGLLWLCVCLPCEYFMCCSHPLVAFQCWRETVFCPRSFRNGKGAFVSVPWTSQGSGDAQAVLC